MKNNTKTMNEEEIKQLLMLDDWQKENGALEKQSKAWNELENIYISAMQAHTSQTLDELKERVEDWEGFFINTGDFGNTEMIKKSDMLKLIEEVQDE